MLHKSAFRFRLLQYMFTISEVALYPVVWIINHLTSPFLLSTKEKSWDIDVVTKRLFYPPLMVLFLAVFGIPAIFGVALRCILHLFRRPYVLSVERSFHPPSINERRSSLTVGRLNQTPKAGPISHVKKQDQSFTVCSANVCLLPELLSRINNLPDAEKRAIEIGERIVVDHFFFQNSMNTMVSVPMKLRRNSHGSKGRNENKEDVEPGHNILTHFPKLDFLCLQETWNSRYSHKLMNELHKAFPWILHDVGRTNFFTNRFFLNSGLMFASKYEILDADFKPFTDSVSQCNFSSKGLLMVKVQVSNTDHHDNVGYIFTTHLQAYQGLENVIQKQLDQILVWTDEFRKDTIRSTDVILFDVLCGDFNFDNFSPVDEHLRNHSLFDCYKDVCRDPTGQDRDWTVGTEMRHSCLWESQVSTPEGLKEALEDPILRHRHIIDGNVKQGTLKEICGTQPSDEETIRSKIMNVAGRRRIDYVLYRKDENMVVQNFSFITRLATLTDHIPVSMTFTSSV